MSTAAPDFAPPLHRRPGLTLYRYVGREALRPAVIGLLGLTVFVLTTNLLGYSDLVINRGVSGADVAHLLVYDAVPVAARMFPFAVLIGALVALGRMGADREILVLEASGVAAGRLVWPIVCFAALMTLVALVLSIEGVPRAAARFDSTLAAVSRERPWAQLRAGAANEFGGWQLEVRELSAAGNALRGVMLWVPEVGETIFARSGTLETGPGGALEITLSQGTLILKPGNDLRQIGFESVTTRLPDSDSALMRSEKERIPSLPISELVARARAWQPSGPDDMPRAALELHRRIAYPLATLVFGVLALPLFLTRRHFSRSGGGVLGLVATFSYYGLMQLSEALLQAGWVGPALAAWLPNLLLAAVAAAMLVRSLRAGVLGHAFDRPQTPERRGLRRLLPGSREPRGEDDRVRSSLHRYALQRYVAGRFLEMLGLAFSVLFVAYLLIDVMDRLQWFSEHGATPVQALRFYGARVWLLASRSVPMALLVGTALTMSLLAVEGELMGMRACGISAQRSTLPVLILTVLIAPLYFLLNNVVVPRTNALADQLKDTEIKERTLRERNESRKAGVWYRSGSQVLEADFFDPDRGQARGVTIFELGEDGLPIGRVDSIRARHIGQGWWRLTEPQRVGVEDGHLRREPAPRHAQLGATVQAEIDTMHLPVDEIAAEARAVEAEGFDATPFWVDYHARLAEPMACVLLPAIAVFLAVSGPPFPGPARTLLVSGILGVVYILVTAIASSLGRGGVVPAVAGAWGPTGLFGAGAALLAARMWRRM